MTNDKLKRLARQIESISCIMQSVAERGDLCNLGDTVIADISEIISDKATELRQGLDKKEQQAAN